MGDGEAKVIDSRMASLASRAESSEQFCMSGDFTAAASSLGTSSAACRNDATEMKVNELV
jgi:hypothetical protein